MKSYCVPQTFAGAIFLPKITGCFYSGRHRSVMGWGGLNVQMCLFILKCSQKEQWFLGKYVAINQGLLPRMAVVQPQPLSACTSSSVTQECSFTYKLPVSWELPQGSHFQGCTKVFWIPAPGVDGRFL